MKKAERLRRLRKLYRLVKAEPAQKLDMSTWGIRTSCGTAQCALGTAALDPEFFDLGLRLRGHRMDDLFGDLRTLDDLREGYNANVVFGMRMGSPAGAEFFGISQRNADFIFSPTKYEVRQDERIPKRAVLDHIRQVINSYSSPAPRPAR